MWGASRGVYQDLGSIEIQGGQKISQKARYRVTIMVFLVINLLPNLVNVFPKRADHFYIPYKLALFITSIAQPPSIHGF